MADGETRRWLPPDIGEEILRDSAERYWRQCHPSFVQDGVPTSQLFVESSGDEGKISGSRETKASAEAAFKFRTEIAGSPSAGSWAVTVKEAWEAGVRIVDDSVSANGPLPPVPPGHSYLDYRQVGKSASKRISRALVIKARARGRQYPPEE